MPHTYSDDDYDGKPSDVRQVGETEEQFQVRMAARPVAASAGQGREP